MVLSWFPVMCHLDKDKQGPTIEPAIAQFFFINNYVIYLITK